MTREEIVNSMSLQDAIQVFKDTNAYGTMDIAKTVILKALQRQSCDYYDTYNKTCRRSEVPKEPCGDAISRQAMLDDLEKSHITSGVRNQGTWNECIDSMMRTVRSMPSVTPQPKTDILDKIRADIEQEYKVESEHSYGQGLRRALEIIDKHNAESEVKQ